MIYPSIHIFSISCNSITHNTLHPPFLFFPFCNAITHYIPPFLFFPFCYAITHYIPPFLFSPFCNAITHYSFQNSDSSLDLWVTSIILSGSSHIWKRSANQIRLCKWWGVRFGSGPISERKISSLTFANIWPYEKVLHVCKEYRYLYLRQLSWSWLHCLSGASRSCFHVPGVIPSFSGQDDVINAWPRSTCSKKMTSPCSIVSNVTGMIAD